jgi:ribonuclease E
MVKRMLVDATHPEETRVVVVSGNRVEEFDFETSTKKQLKGNIYLARVTRVEPSLQAAFVEYGGNRHGFLAFSEIHPDYYRIPVADRQALLAEQARYDEDDDEPAAAAREERAGDEPVPAPAEPPLTATPESTAESFAPASFADALEDRAAAQPEAETGEPRAIPAAADNVAEISAPVETAPADISPEEVPGAQPSPQMEPPSVEGAPAIETAPTGQPAEPSGELTPAVPAAEIVEVAPPEPVQVESIGGDEVEEVRRRRKHRPVRHYKIQEVIKRRQILLVQVVKEERGTKGAALTTYLSLAGRYCVLMPNTARGGGISRRITNAQDRRRLKQIMEELQVPDGMAVILRTAGMERSNAEIKRDYEYLMRLWDDIREMTLRSVAPCLIYEEGNLVKRVIRDVYSSDLEEILVEGETGHEAARSFMQMLMPDHVDRVRRYDDPAVPLFQRFQVEAELDQIHSPTVRLRSGGYIVINQTEALVAIDVNSGRATRERHIEETAFRTNLEAAEEIARQLRLRDLAGLIVIDFIDMEEHRNQHAVERRFKDAMRSDRARIQIGRISPFGLLELSRQRLRPSLTEVSSEICAHCGGTGRVRSTESTVLHVLRGIEEEGMKLRTAEALLHVPAAVALYMLNHKRDALSRIDQRYGLHVVVAADEALIPPAYRLDRVRPREGTPPAGRPTAAPVRADVSYARAPEPADAEAEEEQDIFQPQGTERPQEHRRAPEHGRGEHGRGEHGRGEHGRGERGDEEGGRGRGRRRRRRRGGREGREDRPHRGEMPAMEAGAPSAAEGPAGAAGGEFAPGPTSLFPAPTEAPSGETAPEAGPQHGAPSAPGEEGHGDERGRRRRRRGRRGGRRRRGEEGFQEGQAPETGAHAPRGEPREPRPHEQVAHERPPRERPQRPIIGPGHDLPEDSPFRPVPLTEAPRIEGPGDAHDWPWNRRSERFPEEPVQEAPAAAAPSAEPTPVPSAPAEPPAAEAPAAEEPKGPPRKGWWKRLTS